MIAFRLPCTLAIRLLVGFVIAALPCLSGRAHENFRNFPVSAYGAIGDGQHDDTSAIQSAINACAAAGGGTVLLASGTFCNDVLADRVTIHAPSNSPNTDGIDPICSHDVVISNCTIDTGDDDISVKTDGVVDPDAIPDPTADASHILITGCTILHGHGLSIGSVTTGGIHDVLAKNCTFQDTENGLRIKSGRDRGGKVQRILYRNMTMQNVLYSRARSVG
jgi:polygalacturonase